MKTNHFPQRSADFSPPAILIIAACHLIMLSFATAQDIPVKPDNTKYVGLWNNSPFTSRPVIEAPPPAEPEANPLEDYALVGVSPVTDGFRITLINRTDPTERITVDSSRPEKNEDFKVIGINRSPGRPLATTVTLSTGKVTGTVAFEQDLLTLRAPAATAIPRQPQGAAPTQPGQPPQVDPNRRQPRPRVVAPPAAAQPQGAQGRPQVTPGGRQGTGRPQGNSSRQRTDSRTRGPR